MKNQSSKGTHTHTMPHAKWFLSRFSDVPRCTQSFRRQEQSTRAKLTMIKFTTMIIMSIDYLYIRDINIWLSMEWLIYCSHLIWVGTVFLYKYIELFEHPLVDRSISIIILNYGNIFLAYTIVLISAYTNTRVSCSLPVLATEIAALLFDSNYFNLCLNDFTSKTLISLKTSLTLRLGI